MRINMNERFFELPKEKQDRMINGALEVFGSKGYRYASTDEMVRACGVSKGLWFHYFDNKKGLYSYVCTYAVRFALLEYSIRIDGFETDYFSLRRRIEEIKMSMTDKYPYLPLFIVSFLEEDSEDVVADTENLRQEYRDKYRSFFHSLSAAGFDTPGDMKDCDELLDNAFDNILKNKYKSPVFSSEEYLKEVDKYLKLVSKLNR